MISNKKLRTAKYGYIVISILISAFGITLIAFPKFSVSLLCWIGGVLLILFGLVKIIGYISKDPYRLAFQFDLAFGIFVMALGAVLILRTDELLHIISILFGIGIFADALLKVQIAIDSKNFGIDKWWIILSIAIITGIVGFLLIFRPYASVKLIMILLGISLLSEGILNLITVLSVVKIIENRPKI